MKAELGVMHAHASRSVLCMHMHAEELARVCLVETIKLYTENTCFQTPFVRHDLSLDSKPYFNSN